MEETQLPDDLFMPEEEQGNSAQPAGELICMFPGSTHAIAHEVFLGTNALVKDKPASTSNLSKFHKDVKERLNKQSVHLVFLQHPSVGTLHGILELSKQGGKVKASIRHEAKARKTELLTPDPTSPSGFDGLLLDPQLSYAVPPRSRLKIGDVECWLSLLSNQPPPPPLLPLPPQQQQQQQQQQPSGSLTAQLLQPTQLQQTSQLQLPRTQEETQVLLPMAQQPALQQQSNARQPTQREEAPKLHATSQEQQGSEVRHPPLAQLASRHPSQPAVLQEPSQHPSQEQHGAEGAEPMIPQHAWEMIEYALRSPTDDELSQQALPPEQQEQVVEGEAQAQHIGEEEQLQQQQVVVVEEDEQQQKQQQLQQGEEQHGKEQQQQQQQQGADQLAVCTSSTQAHVAALIAAETQPLDWHQQQQQQQEQQQQQQLRTVGCDSKEEAAAPEAGGPKEQIQPQGVTEEEEGCEGKRRAAAVLQPESAGDGLVMDLSQSQVVGEASRESIGEEDDLTELSEQEEEVGRRREPEAQTAVTPMPRGAAGAAAMARATEGATPQGAMAATGAEAVERLAPAPPEPGLQPLQAPPGSLIFRKGSEAPDLPGEASHQARPPNRSNSVAAAAAAAAAALPSEAAAAAAPPSEAAAAPRVPNDVQAAAPPSLPPTTATSQRAAPGHEEAAAACHPVEALTTSQRLGIIYTTIMGAGSTPPQLQPGNGRGRLEEHGETLEDDCTQPEPQLQISLAAPGALVKEGAKADDARGQAAREHSGQHPSAAGAAEEKEEEEEEEEEEGPLLPGAPAAAAAAHAGAEENRAPGAGATAAAAAAAAAEPPPTQAEAVVLCPRPRGGASQMPRLTETQAASQAFQDLGPLVNELNWGGSSGSDSGPAPYGPLLRSLAPAPKPSSRSAAAPLPMHPPPPPPPQQHRAALPPPKPAAPTVRAAPPAPQPAPAEESQQGPFVGEGTQVAMDVLNGFQVSHPADVWQASPVGARGATVDASTTKSPTKQEGALQCLRQRFQNGIGSEAGDLHVPSKPARKKGQQDCRGKEQQQPKATGGRGAQGNQRGAAKKTATRTSSAAVAPKGKSKGSRVMRSATKARAAQAASPGSSAGAAVGGGSVNEHPHVGADTDQHAVPSPHTLNQALTRRTRSSRQPGPLPQLPFTPQKSSKHGDAPPAQQQGQQQRQQQVAAQDHSHKQQQQQQQQQQEQSKQKKQRVQSAAGMASGGVASSLSTPQPATAPASAPGTAAPAASGFAPRGVAPCAPPAQPAASEAGPVAKIAQQPEGAVEQAAAPLSAKSAAAKVQASAVSPPPASFSARGGHKRGRAQAQDMEEGCSEVFDGMGAGASKQRASKRGQPTSTASRDGVLGKESEEEAMDGRRVSKRGRVPATGEKEKEEEEPTTPLKRRALDKESVPTTRSAAPVSSRATRQATSSSRSPQQLQQQQQHVSPTIPDGRKSIGRLRQQQQQQQQQQVSPTIPGGRKAGGQLPPPQQQQQQHVSPKVDRELAGLLGGMEGISPGVEFGRRRGVRHAHGAQKVVIRLSTALESEARKYTRMVQDLGGIVTESDMPAPHPMLLSSSPAATAPANAAGASDAGASSSTAASTPLSPAPSLSSPQQAMAQRSSGPGRRPRKPSRGTAQGHEGAAAAEDVQGFTHLLLPPQSFSRSMKQLLAVAAGAAIVTPAWLEACHSERIWFIVQDKHMGVDAKAENSWNFNMWSTFCNTQKYGPLLLGIPVHITPSLLRMEPRLKDLVQAAGGTLVQDLASTEEGAKQLLLGNSKEVAELKQRFKKDKAVTVLDKEAFYQAILRYSL